MGENDVGEGREELYGRNQAESVTRDRSVMVKLLVSETAVLSSVGGGSVLAVEEMRYCSRSFRR